MKQVGNYLLILLSFIALNYGPAAAQSTPPPAATRTAARPDNAFRLGDYGVTFQSDPRLIVVMAALDAAGFDPGRGPSVFRTRVRKDQADLDPSVRERLRGFYERNKLPPPATAAEQAARYVSLAFVLGPPPALDSPERSEDLPAGVLEVLDFVPLLREFYRRSGIDEHLTLYLRAYQAEGDRLQPPTAELVRSVLSYLHTRPLLITNERVLVKAPTARKKSNAPRTYAFREHERHFYIVPDLLAAPGTINLRVIADDYYAIVPEGTEPTSSELGRAYLQFVIDPLMLRFNKEIAARREPLRQLLKERESSSESVTPDVFIAVSRSLVGAADARYDESLKLQRLALANRDRLAKAKDAAARTAIAKESQATISAIKDETVARLAEEYERGAVLAFYFAEQLEGIEASGFDIANFFPDMIASFDPVREAKRPAEYADARARAIVARKARKAEAETNSSSTAEGPNSSALVKALSDIEQILRQKDYNGAESRLRELMKEFPGEPRIFFAIAQTSSVAAADATDEDVRDRRLQGALTNYRLAVQAASAETDQGLVSRAHEAMGRIHAFLDQKAEAVSEFEAAIKIGDVRGGAYQAAQEGKKKLEHP